MPCGNAESLCLCRHFWAANRAPIRRALASLSARATALRLREKLLAWHEWGAFRVALAAATVKCMDERYYRRPLRQWQQHARQKAHDHAAKARALQHWSRCCKNHVRPAHNDCCRGMPGWPELETVLILHTLRKGCIARILTQHDVLHARTGCSAGAIKTELVIGSIKQFDRACSVLTVHIAHAADGIIHRLPFPTDPFGLLCGARCCDGGVGSLPSARPQEL